MRRSYCVLAALIFVIALATRAHAAVVVNIDRSVQRMSVIVDGMPRYNWRVSTARRGYITPPGTYHPEMLARHWFSRKYYNSPMPHSIFFYGGFAIHGSYEISHLGRPARSRQCGDPVQSGAARRHGRDHDYDSLGGPSFSRALAEAEMAELLGAIGDGMA